MSNGFFDSDNIPPWDTWVYFYGGSEYYSHILSWVPPEYKALAIQGVNVNPLRCLRWMDDEESIRWPDNDENLIPYRAELKSAGL